MFLCSSIPFSRFLYWWQWIWSLALRCSYYWLSPWQCRWETKAGHRVGLGREKTKKEMEGVHTLLVHYCDRAARDKGHTVEIIYRMALPAGEHTTWSKNFTAMASQKNRYHGGKSVELSSAQWLYLKLLLPHASAATTALLLRSQPRGVFKSCCSCLLFWLSLYLFILPIKT